jgi:hypothetical protein
MQIRRQLQQRQRGILRLQVWTTRLASSEVNWRCRWGMGRHESMVCNNTGIFAGKTNLRMRSEKSRVVFQLVTDLHLKMQYFNCGRQKPNDND